MFKSFSKLSYISKLGYEITYTTGLSAENSTISYLHQTPRFMMYYFIHVSGNIKIEGKHYDIHDGDIIILNPQEMFCCSIDGNKFHERIVLHIEETLLKNFPEDCSSLLSPFLHREKGVSNQISADDVKKYRLDTSVKAALAYAQKGTTSGEILTLCKITELLSELCDITEKEPEKKTIPTTDNPTVNKILDYLNSHFAEEITLEKIAQNFVIDKSYLSHLFKEYVGISVWNYVIFRRISFFNGLINKGMNIEEASIRSGFNNYSNFFRLYKKHTGITPTEYKKQVFKHKNTL